MLASHQTMQKSIITLSLIAFISLACNRQPELPPSQASPEISRNQLIAVNEKMLREEDELINDFITRYQWDMKKTGTGLRYMIYAEGEGPAAAEGHKATVRYTVVLLNGDTCYTDMIRTFVVGKDKIESGLDEGIRLMHVGDKAKFILPSHLAFGLMGDRRAIPQKATLVYDVLLMELNDR